MAVAKEQTKQFFFGNGLAREFVLPFPVPVAPVSETYVFLEKSDADGRNAESVTANYELTRDEAGQVTVRYPLSGEPLPTGKKLTVYRIVPLTQLTVLPNGGVYNGETVESTFDYSRLVDQQLQEQIARAVKIPITSGETPETVMDDLYQARDDAGESAASSAESMASASEAAERAAESAGSAMDSGVRAEKSASLARQWATNPVDEPVLNGEFSSYHWARIAQENVAVGGRVQTVDDLQPDDHANVKTKSVMVASEFAELEDPPGSGLFPSLAGTRAVIRDLETGGTIRPSDAFMAQVVERVLAVVLPISAGAIGMISLLPHRANELPFGWHFCNGDQYELASPVGEALFGLPPNLKSDWGITVSGEYVSIPNMFYTDGRGLFLRAVNGVTRQVGSIQTDAMQTLYGEISYAMGGGIGFNQASGVFNNSRYRELETRTIPMGTMDQYWGPIIFNSALQVRTADETRSLNAGGTPAICLGV